MHEHLSLCNYRRVRWYCALLKWKLFPCVVVVDMFMHRKWKSVKYKGFIPSPLVSLQEDKISYLSSLHPMLRQTVFHQFHFSSGSQRREISQSFIVRGNKNLWNQLKISFWIHEIALQVISGFFCWRKSLISFIYLLCRSWTCQNEKHFICK